MPGAKVEDLRPLVIEWHRQASPVIGTQDFAVSWAEFVYGFNKVRHPLGAELDAILNGVENDPLPKYLDHLGYGIKAQLLSKICFRLAIHHGAEPFFLSCRTAGELLGIHHTEAARIFRAFVADSVLFEEVKGVGKKASRYRWMLPIW